MSYGLSFALLALARAAAAQDAPMHDGSWLIGGSAALTRSHVDVNNSTTTHAALDPTGLYFINSHLAVGGTINLGYDEFPNGHATTYGIGPAIRVYPSSSGAWQPFVAASFTPEWQTIVEPSPPDATSTLYGLEGSLGLTRMLASHVGLDGALFYNHQRGTSKRAASSASFNENNYGLRFGLSVFVH